MRRTEFEHLIRAAADAAEVSEIVVIGSQAILGSHPEAPEEMLLSIEADVYPRDAPEKSIEIDGSLGDGSPFHRQFGYFAHGVGPETARAPRGWQSRLTPVSVPSRAPKNTRIVAHCMEAHDLILAKCVANRERDWDFAAAALRAGIVSIEVLETRIDDLPTDAERRGEIRRALRGLSS